VDAAEVVVGEVDRVLMGVILDLFEKAFVGGDEALGVDQAATLGSWNHAAIILGGIDPELDRLLCVLQRLGVGRAVSHTSGQLRDVGDECVILVAPEDDDFVPVIHDHVSAKRYFKMIAPTCFTWYCFAFAPSR
jgi:hypothetical protein